jgi:putative phage-type endonuclease
VGSSDCSAIMGDSPYSNIHDIYLSKVNPVEEKEPNFAMQLGNTLEPIARAMYEILNDAEFPPANFTHATNPHLRVSLDGFNFERNKTIEIKYCGRNFTAEIPLKYKAQVQYQYAVTGCTSLDLVQINNMNQVNVIPIERDNEYITRMLERVEWFWDCVLNKKEDEILAAMPPKKERKPRKKKGEL